MATSLRLAREQCEKAFAAYLIGRKSPPPPPPIGVDGTDFAGGAQPGCRRVVLQSDGKIVVAGEVYIAGGETRREIARFNPDGTLDMSYDPVVTGGGGSIYCIAIDSTDRVYIGGTFEDVGGIARNRIARLNPDGTADDWDPNASDAPLGFAIQPDGMIVVVGDFSGVNSIGGAHRNNIARLDPITGLADSWNPNSVGNVEAVVIQEDGKIVVCGNFQFINAAIPRGGIARIDQVTGFVDSWNPNVVGNLSPAYLAIASDGNIIVCGGFTFVGGFPRQEIAIIDAVTGLPTAFDAGGVSFLSGIGSVLGVTIQEDGKMIVTGTFGGIGGQPRTGMARLDPVTGDADSWNPEVFRDLFPSVSNSVIQPDGKIIIVGSFQTVGGEPRNNIARFEAGPESDPCPLSFPVDVNVLIRKGELNADGEYVLEKPDEIPLPAVCLAVPRVKPHDGMDYPICELHIMVLNGVDEKEANERQSARFGFVSELFDESHQSEVFAALNGSAFSSGMPVPTFNDGTRDYDWRPAYAALVQVGKDPATDPDFWDATPIESSPGVNEKCRIRELEGGEIIGDWVFERIDGVWELVESYPAGTVATPPVIEDGYSFFYPADDRAVKNFKVFGMYLTEDMGKETGRHWIDHLVYEVHCQPTDDVDSNSQD